MILSHCIKLYPNRKAESYLRRAAGVARHAYNWALARWMEKYESGEKGMSGFSLVKEYNSVKKTEFPWTQEVSKWAPQKAIQDLGDAFKRFFQGKARYPKFKKKGRSKDSFYVAGDHAKVEGKRLRLPKLGWIRMAQAVRFPGVIQNVTLSFTGGWWYASFQVEIDDSYVYPHRCETQASVGVDLGVKALATLSTGEVYENPRVLGEYLRRIKTLSRELARRKKGSKNREKTKKRLAKLHAKVSFIRRLTLHRITSRLVRDFNLIGIEDLNVKGMVKNRSLARAISDASFGEFRRQLAYKAPLAGSEVVLANRFFPSSKTCSVCGEKYEELTLSEREWACGACGVVHDRDVNAAKNLRFVARSHRETRNACGGGVRPSSNLEVRGRLSSSKQESCKPSCGKFARGEE